MEGNMRTVAADSVDRCQAVTRTGQCFGVKIPGCDYCAMHGGRHYQDAQARQGLKNYQLTKFRARLDRLADAPEIKSLRDEVAILRMMLEERLEQCKDTMDLLYQSGPISDLVLKIEKVVTSCNKLELSTGSLLDKQAIMQFGSELIAVLSTEIKDEVLLARISEKIYGTIARTLSCDEANTAEGS